MGGGCSILLIEDDPGIRVTIAEFLVSEGNLVAEACDGAEGLERLRERRPDLIVLDLFMPVMGGRRFLEHLRADQATRDIPVVLMTGATLASQPVPPVEALLVKPFQLEDLVAAVRRLGTRR